MKPVPIAKVTFFSKSTCGYCKEFKGESTDSSGVTKIDPESGWETLTSLLDLEKMGVVFDLYQFGPEKDPKTGKVKNYVLTAPYSEPGRIRGVPHLEISIPGDPSKYVAFDPTGLTSWGAATSVPMMKKWIIQTLQTEPFKSYAAAVRSGTPVNAPTPSVQVSRPAVPDDSRQRMAQAQAQQRAMQQANQPRPENGSQHVHTPHHHHHEHSRQPVQHQAPTTFGMGTNQIRPAATTNTVPAAPVRKPEQGPAVVEKPRPRFVPANYDD